MFHVEQRGGVEKNENERNKGAYPVAEIYGL